MGQPKGSRSAPTPEEFHLGMARSAYFKGRMEVEEFERCVEHVLRGGFLDQRGKVRTPDAGAVFTLNERRLDEPLFPEPQMEVVV